MNRMVKLAAAGIGCTMILAACSQMPWSRDGGWVTLIDGERGLENWKPVADANWRAQDGALVADRKTDKASAFLLSPQAGGKWNTYDITVKGTRITLALNGERTVDVDDKTHAEGPVALQYAGGVVKFRKVQIRPL